MERLAVGIMPTGAMAGALGIAFSERHNVTFGFRSTEKTQNFLANRQIKELSGETFPANIGATEDLLGLAQESDLLVLGTPMKHLRNFASAILPHRREDGKVLCLAKGIEPGTNKTPIEIIKWVDPDAARQTLVLSGPNFADEITRGLPALTVVASEDLELAEWFAQSFSTSTFRIYPTDDVVGVGIGGALGCVITMAAGMSDQKRMGENARAALITRGAAEIKRLGMVLGGREETFDGLSGIGDLVLKCTSRRSRNYWAGRQIAKGRHPQRLMNSKKTIEGLHTVRPAVQLANDVGVEVPIIEAIDQVVNEGLSVDEAIAQLLNRSIVYEDGRPLVYYR